MRPGSAERAAKGEPRRQMMRALRWLTVAVGVLLVQGGMCPPETDEPAKNETPVADAGADRTVVDTDGNGTEAVTLDGSASTDADGTLVAFRWLEGDVELAAEVSPTVNLDVGSHTLTLEVTDDAGATARDEVVIAVNAPDNASPTAEAGADQTVFDDDDDGSASVALDGSGSSDADGDIVAYRWLEDDVEIASGVSATVTLAPGLHSITLEVTDDDGATGTDTVAVTVIGTLTSSAGADTVIEAGESTTLAGTAAGGDASYTFAWTPTIGLSDAAVATPTATPATTTGYTLTVTDGRGATTTDSVTVYVALAGVRVTAQDARLPILSACGAFTDDCTTSYPRAVIRVTALSGLGQVVVGSDTVVCEREIGTTEAFSTSVTVTDGASGAAAYVQLDATGSLPAGSTAITEYQWFHGAVTLPPNYSLTDHCGSLSGLDDSTVDTGIPFATNDPQPIVRFDAGVHLVRLRVKAGEGFPNLTERVIIVNP